MATVRTVIASLDHVVYGLGSPIVPSQQVRTGNLFRAARVWTRIDLLLTAPTIAAAAALSRSREAQLCATPSAPAAPRAEYWKLLGKASAIY